MINNLVLDIWLLAFLLFTLYELKTSDKLPKLNDISKMLPKNCGKIMAFNYVLLLTLLFFKDSSILNKLFIFTLSTSIFGHSLWLSSKYGYLSGIAGSFVIALRILMPNSFTHNIFVISAIVWIGPILYKYEIITIKRFLTISIAWFIYDIVYVWATSVAIVTNQASQTAGFPMGIVSGGNMLGNADLFWANLLLIVIPDKKHQLISVALLIVADILLGIYMNTNNGTIIFPLLVLWVPIGLLVNKEIFFSSININSLQKRLKKR